MKLDYHIISPILPFQPPAKRFAGTYLREATASCPTAATAELKFNSDKSSARPIGILVYAMLQLTAGRRHRRRRRANDLFPVPPIVMWTLGLRGRARTARVAAPVVENEIEV